MAIARETRSQSPTEELIPVTFNKRLFEARQSAVLLTEEARRIMQKNTGEIVEDRLLWQTKAELFAMRSVVDGLRLIHRGRDYVKDALSHVVTLEHHPRNVRVSKGAGDRRPPCYFVMRGALEVTYDFRVDGMRNVYQPNVAYTHSSGEYIGLVSAEGLHEDLAPPSAVVAKDDTELLRLDRERFHEIIAELQSGLAKEKKSYLRNGGSFLSSISGAVQEKIVNLILKEEYPPNKLIIRQGECSKHLYIIVSGQCECYRELYIPEAGESFLFCLSRLNTDNIFAEECLLGYCNNYCSVVTTGPVVCYKLPRSAFEMVGRENLLKFVGERRHFYAGDFALREKGCCAMMWNYFKYKQVFCSLLEGGKLKYMTARTLRRPKTKPPLLSSQRQENMFQFALKGSQYQPVRAISAPPMIRRPHPAPCGKGDRNETPKTCL